MKANHYDYIIVGGCIAGLYIALLAIKRGSVLILTKGSIDDCNTKYAQGGIAVAMGRDDSPEVHFEDTIAAGDGLSDAEAVRILTDEAADCIADLIKFGVPFDTLNGEITLTREAAHSVPRVMDAGGAGRLFKYPTNSDGVTGDGIAVAFEAGADISDMEFFQFHPTVLRLPGVAPFLISEAARGEGGILRNVEGHRFMPDYAGKAELATRDIVARSIVYEMKKTHSDRVFLDVTHLPSRLITTRFPHIYRFFREHR